MGFRADALEAKEQKRPTVGPTRTGICLFSIEDPSESHIHKHASILYSKGTHRCDHLSSMILLSHTFLASVR
jgi:hypothetical protein